MTGLKLAALTQSHPGFSLGPIDLTVEQEVLAILGPSGCGKTTLLSLIAGIQSQKSGTITLDGRSLDGLNPESRNATFLFQDGALFPHMTARENIEYAVDSQHDVTSLAAKVEVQDILDLRPNALSGGQKQRVALARALAADPDVLLLDEPFANLDTPIKRRLRDELRKFLLGLDIPVIYVTHDQRDASVIGDRIAVMNDGRIHQTGTPTAVFEQPTTAFVARFSGNPNLFQGQIVDTKSPTLSWQGYDLSISEPSPVESGTTVQFCIRPEQIQVVAAAEAEGGTNVVPGTATHTVYTGEGYRLDIQPEGTNCSVTATVSSSVFERLAPATHEQVGIVVDADHIHVLGEHDFASE